MKLLKIYLFALLISSNQILVAQEDVAEGEAPSTVQQLLELVKEGQVREQSENAVVPGFETQHNLFRSEALVGLSKRQGGVCTSLENVAHLKNINKKTKPASPAIICQIKEKIFYIMVYNALI